MEENKILLQTKGICKQFSGIQVLKNVSLDVRCGEVHALMGENGAGKSTIIKIITGVYSKDAGEILIDGAPVEINSRQDARNCGISVIYQELSLIPALTVTENIFLGQENCKFGYLNKKNMRDKVKQLIEQYEFALNPDAIVQSLGMAQRQMVEILKALAFKARLIIMDEPTASLSASETEKLFNTIDGLRKKGASIIYISHRLEEVYKISDRLTVMRDGEIVGVLNREDINPMTVTKMMIGHEIKQNTDRKCQRCTDGHCLEVKNLRLGNLLKDVSFKAYGGEVLGIGGLVGSGRTELIKCIYGAIRRSGGEVLVDGKPVSHSIAKNIRAGFGLVPEDRRNEGFIPLLSIEKNAALPSYDRLSKLGFISHKKEIAHSEGLIKDYDIRPAIRKYCVGNLSGGNQQKVVVAKWLARSPSLLLLDEPTAGVDVGVKADIYRYVWELADSGAIVVIVSSDLEELLYVSDRILVMHGGRFFEEFTRNNVTQTSILLAASGEHTQEGTAL
jgi:ribose transport system ATP-binding protein